MSLKDNLKRIRKSNKISQKKLAEISGVSYSMVCKLESGEQSNPSLETIDKISSALEVNSSDLIGIGAYFDLKINPNDDNFMRLNTFVKYLESIGYLIELEPEVLEWHLEDVIENEKIIGKAQVSDNETFIAIIKNGDTSATMSKAEFEKFQLTIEKAIEFEIFKQTQRE